MRNNSGLSTTNSNIANLSPNINNFCTVVADWNTATANGWYAANSGANTPIEGWVYGVVSAIEHMYVKQVVFCVYDNGAKYERIRVASDWSPWVNTGASALYALSEAINKLASFSRITLALVDENLAGYGQSSPMMECMVYGHLCLINFKFGIKGGIGSWEVKKIATGTPTPLGANVSYCCNPVIAGGQGGEVMVTADYEGNLIVQGREQALSNNNWLEGTLIYFVP